MSGPTSVLPARPSPSRSASAASDQAAQEAVVHLPVQDETTGGGAPLTGRAERAPEHAFEREVEIGVVHHDHGVLAAHLERQPLVHAAAGLADDRARSRSSR